MVRANSFCSRSGSVPCENQHDELNEHRSTAQHEKYRPLGAALGRPRVLVAEDNATNRKIIAQILEYGGFDVTLATTGTQAVETPQQAVFDVVILDKHMPGMSGMEVAARYLQLHGENAAPMIMLTAEATAEAMQECKAAGMKALRSLPICNRLRHSTLRNGTAVLSNYVSASIQRLMQCEGFCCNPRSSDLLRQGER